ncbi:MAG: DUF4416 family protein [Candidatus Omnitrophica bacterium]|nr:DUF4416 family protein [Candidatus Omnitrophota bacterium]
MGSIVKWRPVKLIAGIITSSEERFSKTAKALKRLFGPIDFISQLIDFDSTDYYQKEMGQGLKRRFMSFKRLIDPARLAQIKLTTNKLEKSLFKGIKDPSRPVNIDPGYITEAKLVLASTKDYYHRIYLKNGIYAEMTLCYKDSSFAGCDWTYRDYMTGECIRMFNDIRSIYMRQR